MPAITNIRAREVLDSRGRPTVEVDVHAAGGTFGRAIVPSGASTGAAEALELRDGDPSRYEGRGVLQAVANVNDLIAAELAGCDTTDQLAVDERLRQLDDTPQKTKLGANAMLGVSLAAAHAAAAADEVPLYRHFHRLIERLARETSMATRPVRGPTMPLPMTNMISGGLHAGGNLDFQDFLIMPVGAPDYRTALRWIVGVYERLGELLADGGYEGRLVGDEGGFGPRLAGNRQAAELVVRAVEAAHLRPGEDVTLALDVAASHFFDGGHYCLAATETARLTSDQMIDLLEEMVGAFPITSIEDGLAEEDWTGWQDLTRRLGNRVQLVGDDLFATNSDRLERGIDTQAANSVLIKMNQIGTVSETLRTVLLAESAGMAPVVSARSGETEDTSIADLAVGTSAGQIKIGSVARSERLAKYNRLLRIEEEIGAEARGW